MTGRLDDAAITSLLAGVDAADAEHRRDWPGPPETRQPVQVLYLPADRVGASTVPDVGAAATRLLDAHAGDPQAFASAMGIGDADLAVDVRTRVATKLRTEPLEDLRIDFEDGYLGRDDATEDTDAVAAARAVAAHLASGTAPPYVGVRVKSFTDGLARRSVRTLDRFLGALLAEAGALPDGFVVTFPKIVAIAHVEAFAGVLGALEAAHGLRTGQLCFEAQIETTPSVLDASGLVTLRAIRAGAAGRLVGAHLGVYDYSAGLGLPPASQRLDHPACDAVRHVMQVTFAGTEVRLSDGSTNVVPAEETDAELARVWARHAADVRHSLRHGYVQGWDLHPAHLVSRYAVVFADLLDGMDGVLDRLARWDRGEAGGGVLDEPATIRVLERQVQRAVDCGALSTEEVAERTGRAVQPRPARLRVPTEEPTG